MGARRASGALPAPAHKDREHSARACVQWQRPLHVQDGRQIARASHAPTKEAKGVVVPMLDGHVDEFLPVAAEVEACRGRFDGVHVAVGVWQQRGLGKGEVEYVLVGEQGARLVFGKQGPAAEPPVGRRSLGLSLVDDCKHVLPLRHRWLEKHKACVAVLEHLDVHACRQSSDRKTLEDVVGTLKPHRISIAYHDGFVLREQKGVEPRKCVTEAPVLSRPILVVAGKWILEALVGCDHA